MSLAFLAEPKGVTVSTSNVSDSSQWESSPRFDCLTLPEVSPPPPLYTFKVMCRQRASVIILHRTSDASLGLMEIQVYSQEGTGAKLTLDREFFQCAH